MAKHRHIPKEEGGDEITRFGVSMTALLLNRFDALIATRAYTNRSEAIRDLVRDYLVEADWETNTGKVIGVVSMVYDHEMRMLGDRLTDLQHRLSYLVVSTLHVHLDDRDCLEVVVMSGQGEEVRELANRLLSLKGVKHGRLLMAGSAEKAGE